ncbi:MAG TPA: T9SS type A sorting domain-containing protein, partial [Prolixibacteraceae bacterium]|nr:T9SS type A sorting domain-containing protein [Prolixibacteraceae bacterium]
GVLQCYDNSGTYSTLSWNIEVPAEKSAALRLDSRAYYTGKLSGEGTLNLYIPFVRSDLNGDMSTFAGTLNIFSSYSEGTAELRINNSKGLPGALVNIEAGVSASNTQGSSLILGALSGTGSLDGSENYQIGAKGIDSEFRGRITAGSVSKVGPGVLTLSNANTYPGSTLINGGTLYADNPSGSATGTGPVSVNNGGMLMGTGSLSGKVHVESGGILAPGNSNTGNKLKINNSLELKAGSIFRVKANPLFKISDQVQVSDTISIHGILEINNTTTASFSVGDEYKLFDCTNIEGGFSSIIPEYPGNGMEWDHSDLIEKGVIKVVEASDIQAFRKNEIKIFPNPAGEYLIVQMQETGDELNEIYICDLAGKIRVAPFRLTGNETYIPLEKLLSGIYFVKQKGQSYKYEFIKK